MKKLTAGIFTVLMGLVSVNAADAAVASKGYVDNKFFTKQAQTEHVAAQKAIDDAQDVKINKNTTDIATNAEKIGDATFTDETLKYIKGEADLTAAVKKLDAAVTDASADLSNVYTKTDADAKFIDTDEIAGYATDAELTEVTNAYKAADTETLNSAKAYTDAEVKELADGAVATNTAAIAAINNDTTGVLATAKKYADDAVAGEVTRADQAYDVKGAAATAQSAAETTAKNYTDAEIAKINSADTGILKQAKDYTDEQIEALDLEAISRVPAECGTKGNYCVLTTNGAKFVWEVIVRDDTTLGEGDTGLYGDYPATESTVTQ